MTAVRKNRMYKVTLFDISSYPTSNRVISFYTDDINDFEKHFVSLCKNDKDRVKRFRRSKAGECISDGYMNIPAYNMVQEDPAAEFPYEKPATLHDVTFFATNAYGWQEQYHVDDWYCTFRWIRYRKKFIRVVSFRAVGVCMIRDDGSLKDVTCFGNPVLINHPKYIVEYNRGVPVTDHPLTHEDFAGNIIETFCWLPGERFNTELDAEDDFRSFEVTEEIMDRMFREVIGEAG